MTETDVSEATAELTKLVPGAGRDGTVSANYYLGLTAVLGAVLWGFTAVVYHLFTPIEEGVREVALVGAAGLVVGVWLLVFTARFVLGTVGVERDVLLSAPGVIWLLVMASAFAANVAAFYVASPLREALTWLPWYAGYAVAYLLTGVMVRRGGVYVLGGLLAAVGLAAGVGVLPLDAVGLGYVGPTRPFPLPFVAIGLIHVVPMAVDARRGGRQLTGKGISAIKADALGDVEVGGSGPDTTD